MRKGMKPKIYPYAQKNAHSSIEKVVFLISVHAITNCINYVTLKTDKQRPSNQAVTLRPFGLFGWEVYCCCSFYFVLMDC